jgi:hypothetical protein
MKETYEAIFTGDKVTWIGTPPPPSDRPIRARIDLHDQPELKGTDGKVLAAVCEDIARKTGGIQSIPDPVAWQREQRNDRPLPGRE